MVHIEEPLSACTIGVVELVRQPDADGTLRVLNSYEFASIKGLKAYLQGHYAVALSLGYEIKPKPDPAKYNTLVKGRLSIKYTDRFASSTFEFEGVKAFVAFLDKQLALARAVGYQKRPTRPGNK